MRSARIAFVGLTAALAITLGASARAQAPAAAPRAAEAADEIKELAPAPGGYSYNPQGRRDPFQSLVRRGTGTDPGLRKAGIEGLLIQELALKGILKNIDGYIAFLAGPDGKSYWVRSGQRFFDGQLTVIDATTVTFRQDVTDPLSPVKARDVKKYLYPSEEATQ
jgi:Tfp pilus assembly protein PilP